MDEDSLEAQLATMPLFAGLTDDQLADVAGTVLDRRVKPGKAVIKAGNWGHEFVLVLAGEVDVVRDGQVVATLGPGDHVGELAVLEDVRRNATVVAKTPVVIGAIDTGQFRALLAEIPLLATRIAGTAAERTSPPPPS
jgi:CRP/FNR family transcriptional regulator, cyclic AMP receptor protein